LGENLRWSREIFFTHMGENLRWSREIFFTHLGEDLRWSGDSSKQEAAAHTTLMELILIPVEITNSWS
jgi:hypothetical protein